MRQSTPTCQRMHAKHGAVQPQTLFNGAIATGDLDGANDMHSPRQPKLTPTGMVVSQTLPRKNTKAATKSAGGMPRTQAPLQSIAPAFARAAVLYGLCWFLSRRQPSQRRGTSAPADTQTTVVSVPLPLPCCFTNPPGQCTQQCAAHVTVASALRTLTHAIVACILRWRRGRRRHHRTATRTIPHRRVVAGVAAAGRSDSVPPTC